MLELNLQDEDYDLDEEEIEDEIIENNIGSADKFCADLRVLAVSYIDGFFSNKKMHCGGPIPKKFLHDPKKVCMVMNTSISEGVDIAYSGLERNIANNVLALSRKTGESTTDIKLVNESLKLLAKSGIPQQFAGGLLVLYLEFCEGVKF